MALSTELLVVGTAALLSLAACVVSKSSLDDGANVEGQGSSSTSTGGGGSASPDVNPSSQLDLGLPDGAEGQAFDLGSDDDIGGGAQLDLGDGGDETPSKFDFGGGADDGPKFDLGDGGDDGSKLDLGGGGDGGVKLDVGG